MNEWLGCSRGIIVVCSVDELIELERVHAFDFFFDLAVVLSIIWLDAALRFALILTHEVANIATKPFVLAIADHMRPNYLINGPKGPVIHP